ncbi:MAG TPA: sugar phosphate nucleotidyltransferase [Candidatus Limnocylindria bacterium]|nr:sugar phosphate nucleotidyltransferase [Candidatus Limnocylindria bacterium]
MQNKPILVVMAAGVGSRYGGLKQMSPFGAHGESLVDYSVFDALRAGFERVVYIVNNRIKDDFREVVGRHAEGRAEVRYVMQELDMLPEGLTVPPGRTKPWGTAHAILCCKGVIDAPFCALNGDDFYGLDAMRKMYGFLSANPAPHEYAMVGFELANTLSDAGYVSRGECKVGPDGYLESIVERLHVIPSVDGPLYTEDGSTYHLMPKDSVVSMNMWGFTPQVITEIEERFPAFHEKAMRENPEKAEFYLPNLVGDLLRDGKVTVKVLTSGGRWFGVTNPSDQPRVVQALKELTQNGEYPDGLWK